MKEKDYNLYDLHHGTRKRIIQKLDIGCSLCGAKHENANVIWDFHHIEHRANGGGNEDDNVTYICPNCHRGVHNIPGFDMSKLISIAKIVGDAWKAFYNPRKH